MALGDAKPTVISIIVYIIVIVAGAVILMFMEKEGMKKTVKNEEERPTNASLMQSRPKNLTQHAKEYLENHGAKKWTTIDVAKLLKEIDSFRSKKRDNDAEDKSKSWRQKIDLGTFAKWEYFVVGTVSTIGYGDITPITSGARILTVLVQVIGIPINLYMFASIAAFLTKCISCLKSSIASKCQRRRASKPNIACFFFCIFLVLLYVGAGGIAVGLSQGWKWHDSIYWSFTVATTVGYGDILPKCHSLFAFAFFGVIVMMMPVYALFQALKADEEVYKEDRLMAKPEEI